jgi:hypothetical protein
MMPPKETVCSPMKTSVSDPARHHLFKPEHTPIFRKVPLWIVLPAVVISLLYVGSVFGIAILLGAILIAFGSSWVIVSFSRQTTALAIEGDRLVYQSWGRTRSWPLLDITRLVRGTVLVEMLKGPSYSHEHLMFINGSGRCFLRLGHEWDHTRIAHTIGVAIQPIDDSVITAGDAARLYPGSFSWMVANPWGRYGVSIATGTVLFIAIMLFIAWRG